MDDTVSFIAMADGTAEDYALLERMDRHYMEGLVGRVLAHLDLLKEGYGGYKIDRYQHSLQTATRAHRAGRDEEYVVCALLHDIGDTLGPRNHADVAAAILKPFVSERNHWIVEKHAIFQGYYFFEYLGLDKNMRKQFEGHPWFDYTAEFCEKYDQSSFDPDYESLPLGFFEQMIRHVMARPRRSIYLRQE